MKKGLAEHIAKKDADEKLRRKEAKERGELVAPGVDVLLEEGYDPLKHSREYRAKMMGARYQLPGRGVVVAEQRAARARAQAARAQLLPPPPPPPFRRILSAPTKQSQLAEKSTGCPCGSGRPLKSCCVAFAPVKEKAAWEATSLKCRHVFDIDIPIDEVPQITKKTISQKMKENPDYVTSVIKRWLALKGNNFQWPSPGDPDPNKVRNKFQLFYQQCVGIPDEKTPII